VLLVVIDERLEQHAADDAENGGIRADAEGQRENDGDRQAAGPDQGTKRVAEVGQQSHIQSIQR
jgi:hypothetical protein